MAAPRSSETGSSSPAGPIRPSEVVEAAGRAFQVKVVSDQALLGTGCTSPPEPLAEASGRVCMKSRAFVTLPGIAGTRNFR